MESKPTFFMSTAGEYEPLAAPRACWELVRLADSVRNDHMLIRIEPTLDGQRFGLGAAEVDHLLISARHRGDSLYPVSQWPCMVYVSRVLDMAIVSGGMFDSKQIELIAWGTIFATREEAHKFEQRYGK